MRKIDVKLTMAFWAVKKKLADRTGIDGLVVTVLLIVIAALLAIWLYPKAKEFMDKIWSGATNKVISDFNFA